MSLKGRRCLVTGAGGFIGSHLTEHLVRAGATVRAFVHYNALGRWGWLDQAPDDLQDAVEVVAGDISDPQAVRAAVEGCDVVFHLAALIGIPYSYRAPFSYVQTNIHGSLNVVQACKDCRTPRMVHTSTSEVYGTAEFVPITEQHPLKGQSPYAATKIGADQLVLSYHRSFGTPVTVVRPFNTYGPRQSTRAIIPTVITQVLDGRTRIRLGALEPTRDFNFVNDTVRGFAAAAVSDAAIGEVINLGSQFEVSIGNTCRLIGTAMGVDLEIETDPDRLRPQGSEVLRLFADNSKAKTLLGWSPEYGGLDGFRRGLSETAAWFGVAENRTWYAQRGYAV